MSTPSDTVPNYITPAGFSDLKNEFNELFNVERPKVVEVVAWAASNGDRSENGDYIYGKRRLREIDRRLHFLKKRIEGAQVVDPSQNSSTKIAFGAQVTYETEEGESKKIQIVGEDEINTEQGKISWKSPLAKSLLGKEVDDEVEVRRPKDVVLITVLEVKYQ